MADKMLRKGRIDGRILERADIRVGVKVEFPSGMGGWFTYVCTESEQNFANFTALGGYKDIIASWQLTVSVEFDVPDFTLDEWNDLAKAMRWSFHSGVDGMPVYFRELIGKADALGYVDYLSFTQFQWTEFGVKALQKALEPFQKAV